ncbi:MAG: PAS domain S-box protein, partial [Candidatus Obscuribacterales bacterium]|nr:PAS domain S-box protein [Candidatus Obscuribacterales bacterium]
EGNLTSANPAAYALYGYESGELPGLPLSSLVPEAYYQETEDLFSLLRKGDSIGHFETVRMSKRGDLIDVDLSISPVRDNQGQICGFASIARDISARKEAERRISEFYSTVSHELRTPLTSIRASLGLLEGGVAGTLNAEVLQLVEIARSESDRLIMLINDILDLRKIEAGKLELHLRELQLPSLLNNAIESIRAMADENSVKLKTPNCPDLKFVADHDRLIQVLHNLVSNAIKYSRKNGEVEIKVEERPGRRLHFSVIDSGPGIRSDQMHKLFGKFQQLDSSDSRPKGGTGLGLAISKAIVEEHGGRVGVNSRIGEGSTFWFELPLDPPECEQAQEAKITASKTGKAIQKEEITKQEVSILIIEDDKSTIELLRKQLNRSGFSCKSAPDAETALNVLKNSKPDLLILDVGLPNIDGFALIKILRNSEMANLPLLVYTSMDLSESDKKKLSLGPSIHLIKSITSQEDIILAIKNLLASGSRNS